MQEKLIELEKQYEQMSITTHECHLSAQLEESRMCDRPTFILGVRNVLTGKGKAVKIVIDKVDKWEIPIYQKIMDTTQELIQNL